VDAPLAPRGRDAARSRAACRRRDASPGPSLWVARRADSRPRRAARWPQVKDFETFRSKLPAGTQLFVAKNTLVKKAIAGTPYEALGSACVGPNAFLFSGEDVASSIKAFNDMAKAVKKSRNMELMWNGGVMDGKFIAPKDIGKLESLPTKKQLIGQIAGAIKQVTTKVARGVNGVALKLAYGTKAIADGKSDLIKA
jgi:large subunit ribosomal protein L10